MAAVISIIKPTLFIHSKPHLNWRLTRLSATRRRAKSPSRFLIFYIINILRFIGYISQGDRKYLLRLKVEPAWFRPVSSSLLARDGKLRRVDDRQGHASPSELAPRSFTRRLWMGMALNLRARRHKRFRFGGGFQHRIQERFGESSHRSCVC